MPVQYGSIVEEHQATRTEVGLFDVSHMGRLRIPGANAGPFLDRVLTRSALRVPAGRVRYSLVVNESGGILDDVLVYRLEGGAGRDWYELVVNAGNRDKIVRWLEGHGAGAADVGMVDRTVDTAMIAVQGPRAVERLEGLGLVEGAIGDLKYYSARPAVIAGVAGVVSRTGYTGEDGVELTVDAQVAVEVWERLVAAGGRPVGLGARDTLRLEAAMPLYGHELTESIDPFTADLAFAVDFAEGREFVGRAALTACAQRTDRPRRVGLVAEGKRAPREGYEIWAESERVGYVTSGTFSPTLARPIAMAYVAASRAEPGQQLDVEIRGARERVEVVRLPFYKRKASA